MHGWPQLITIQGILQLHFQFKKVGVISYYVSTLATTRANTYHRYTIVNDVEINMIYSRLLHLHHMVRTNAVCSTIASWISQVKVTLVALGRLLVFLHV